VQSPSELSSFRFEAARWNGQGESSAAEIPELEQFFKLIRIPSRRTASEAISMLNPCLTLKFISPNLRHRRMIE